jgi:hypothetical protein
LLYRESARVQRQSDREIERWRDRVNGKESDRVYPVNKYWYFTNICYTNNVDKVTAMLESIGPRYSLWGGLGLSGILSRLAVLCVYIKVGYVWVTEHVPAHLCKGDYQVFPSYLGLSQVLTNISWTKIRKQLISVLLCGTSADICGTTSFLLSPLFSLLPPHSLPHSL